jgi:DNA-directed RNA polymerase sigma subunit (sigma70/sigma32)
MEPMTLKAIGEVVGVTRERVRQIEQDALRQLHETLDEN